jgi:hypothetical protein
MALIAILAGDGIGPEVTAEARRVLEALDLGLTLPCADPESPAPGGVRAPDCRSADRRPPRTAAHRRVAILAGDGIGPEVTAEARRVLEALDLGLTFEEATVSRNRPFEPIEQPRAGGHRIVAQAHQDIARQEMQRSDARPRAAVRSVQKGGCVTPAR